MEQIVQSFINNEDVYVPTLIASAIILGILISSISKIITSFSTERTRREIAAYIAEGSMTPEQGERLLNSNKPRRCN